MAKQTQTKALVVQPKAELADWEKQLASDAKEDRATFQSGVPRITVDTGKDGNLTFKADGNDLGQEIVLAVIETAWSKQYYKEAYVPGKAATPECYALGRKEKGLLPHVNAPLVQSDQCDTCQWNKFGTATVGRGKRCTDKPRMLVILGHDTEGDVRRAATYQVDIPAASIGNFNEYLSGLGDFTRTGNVRECLTRLRAQMRPGAKGHEIKFSFEKLLPGEAVQYILTRRATAYEQLTQPFPKLSEEAAPPVDSKPIKGQKAKR